MPIDRNAADRPPANRWAARSLADLRNDLRVVEEELASLGEAVAAVREQLADPLGGTTDPADQAAALTAVEEQEALRGALEARRNELRRRLREES